MTRRWVALLSVSLALFCFGFQQSQRPGVSLSNEDLAAGDAATVTGATPTWQEFTADDRTFAASFPTPPTITAETGRALADKPMTHIFASKVEGFEYIVAFSEHQSEELAKRAWDERRGKWANGHFKILEEKIITVQGDPGRDYTIKDGWKVIYAKEVLVGRRLYIAGAESVYGQSQSPLATQFLDSFRIIKK